MPKELDKNYIDTTKISLKLITKDAAKEMIEKNHYSHKFSATRYALGVYYTEVSDNPFFEGDVDKLIGCMTYGYPVGRLAADSISDLIQADNVLELTRLFIHDGYGSNIESYALGLSFKWLRANDRNIKVLISYADPQVGHLGGIYQSTNWKYQGDSMRLVDTYSLKYSLDDPLWVHSRTIFSNYGSNNVEILKKQIGKTFWLKLEERKHRYIYFLCGKNEANRILNNLKHPIQQYPKQLKQFEEKIMEITI